MYSQQMDEDVLSSASSSLSSSSMAAATAADSYWPMEIRNSTKFTSDANKTDSVWSIDTTVQSSLFPTMLSEMEDADIIDADRSLQTSISTSGMTFDSFAMQIPLGVALATLSALTFLGNAMVVHAIRTERKLHTVSNMFILSLAIADATVGVFVMPISVCYVLLGDWRLGFWVCQSWLVLDYTASTASILNLLILSLDRYWSIRRPLQYLCQRTKKRALVMIAGVWMCSALWTIPILGWHIWYKDAIRKHPENVCETEFSDSVAFKTGTVIANFIIPMTLMVLIYYRIFVEIKKRANFSHEINRTTITRVSCARHRIGTGSQNSKNTILVDDYSSQSGGGLSIAPVAPIVASAQDNHYSSVSNSNNNNNNNISKQNSAKNNHGNGLSQSKKFYQQNCVAKHNPIVEQQNANSRRDVCDTRSKSRCSENVEVESHYTNRSVTQKEQSDKNLVRKCRETNIALDEERRQSKNYTEEVEHLKMSSAHSNRQEEIDQMNSNSKLDTSSNCSIRCKSESRKAPKTSTATTSLPVSSRILMPTSTPPLTGAHIGFGRDSSVKPALQQLRRQQLSRDNSHRIVRQRSTDTVQLIDSICDSLLLPKPVSNRDLLTSQTNSSNAQLGNHNKTNPRNMSAQNEARKCCQMKPDFNSQTSTQFYNDQSSKLEEAAEKKKKKRISKKKPPTASSKLKQSASFSIDQRPLVCVPTKQNSRVASRAVPADRYNRSTNFKSMPDKLNYREPSSASLTSQLDSGSTTLEEVDYCECCSSITPLYDSDCCECFQKQNSTNPGNSSRHSPLTTANQFLHSKSSNETNTATSIAYYQRLTLLTSETTPSPLSPPSSALGDAAIECGSGLAPTSSQSSTPTPSTVQTNHYCCDVRVEYILPSLSCEECLSDANKPLSGFSSLSSSSTSTLSEQSNISLQQSPLSSCSHVNLCSTSNPPPLPLRLPQRQPIVLDNDSPTLVDESSTQRKSKTHQQTQQHSRRKSCCVCVSESTVVQSDKYRRVPSSASYDMFTSQHSNPHPPLSAPTNSNKIFESSSFSIPNVSCGAVGAEEFEQEDKLSIADSIHSITVSTSNIAPQQQQQSKNRISEILLCKPANQSCDVVTKMCKVLAKGGSNAAAVVCDGAPSSNNVGCDVCEKEKFHKKLSKKQQLSAPSQKNGINRAKNNVIRSLDGISLNEERVPLNGAHDETMCCLRNSEQQSEFLNGSIAIHQTRNNGTLLSTTMNGQRSRAHRLSQCSLCGVTMDCDRLSLQDINDRGDEDDEEDDAFEKNSQDSALESKSMNLPLSTYQAHHQHPQTNRNFKAKRLAKLRRLQRSIRSLGGGGGVGLKSTEISSFETHPDEDGCSGRTSALGGSSVYRARADSMAQPANEYCDQCRSMASAVSAAAKHRQELRREESSRLRQEKKAARQLGVILGAFIACWTPYIVTYVVTAYCTHCVSLNAHQVTIWLGYLNSFLNPFLYALCNENFKHAFKRMLGRGRDRLGLHISANFDQQTIAPMVMTFGSSCAAGLGTTVVGGAPTPLNGARVGTGNGIGGATPSFTSGRMSSLRFNKSDNFNLA